MLKKKKKKVKTCRQIQHEDYEQAKWALVKALKDLKEYGLLIGKGDDFETVQDAVKEVFEWTVVIL